MFEDSSHHTFNPGGPGTPEIPVPQDLPAEAAELRDEAGPESHATPDPSDSPEAGATGPVKRIALGIPEWFRADCGELKTYDVQYSVDPMVAHDYREMVDRAGYTRDPLKQMVIPTNKESFGTTEELFVQIRQSIAEQTGLSEKVCALMTFWIFSTWFQDVLPLAPGLAITGWAHEGDVVLRTLGAFSYHPILMAGITSATLNDISWERKPTLLISEPALNKRMAVILGSSTSRGYLAFRKLAGYPTSPFDYFSSKALFLGEDPQMISVLQNYLHINASPAPVGESQNEVPLSEEMTLRYQNQLMGYRIACARGVFKSDFNVRGLSPEINAIASVLGKCFFSAPALQDELVSLLQPVAQQQVADRLDDLGTLVAGAALSLCHQGKDQIMVGEIAAEVNRVLKGRGERLQYSPEKVGHKLKKAGLLSRRLGAAGNGFVLDRATQVLLHEVAAAYGCGGLVEDKENLHCPLCIQNK
jgi:hypothetical protein